MCGGKSRRVFLASTVLALTSAAPGPAHASPPPPDVVREGFLSGADRVPLFFRKVGSGADVVVYLHGGPGSNFRGNGTEMDALARGRTLVMYDQRGSGRSEIVTDPKRLTVEHHLRDLDAVRRFFGARRISLIGLSWGSGLAVLYAARHPERVERLLLVSPMPITRALLDARKGELAKVLGEEGAARWREIRGAMARANDVEALALCREMSDLTFQAYLKDPTPEALAKAAQRCDIPPAAFRNRAVVEAATLASLGDWDFRSVLSRLRMPALVLEGRESKLPLEPTREWARALPEADLLLIPQAGHELFLDQPVVFLAAADEFLKGRVPAGAAPVAH
jgi:proline iminopeptidase